MQPAFRIDGGRSGLGLFVVAFHDAVAARAQLAGLAGGQRVAGRGIDDAHFGVGQRGADGGDACLERIVNARHRDHGRGLSLAVRDRDLTAMHTAANLAHDFDGTGGAGHDAGAQTGEVERIELGMLKLCDEHGGDAVERSGAFAIDGFEGGAGIELR